jgi:glucose-6-phosphate-specific signal transduction histidine kinase
MWWFKLAAKVVLLIVPISLLISWVLMSIVLPHLGSAWYPLLLVGPLLALLIANWIWPHGKV